MTQIEFYNENCFDTMSRMKKENKKVDIILTSPPYNTARTQKSQRSFDNYENRYDIHLDSMTDEEYAQWTLDLFKAYDEILVKDGVILYNVSYESLIDSYSSLIFLSSNLGSTKSISFSNHFLLLASYKTKGICLTNNLN